MEVIIGIILLLQVVILIQIMQGKKRVLQYCERTGEKVDIQVEKKQDLEFQRIENNGVIREEGCRENAMKLVDEVLTEVFS